MTQKRYQVFVSSTFVDLREERQRVMQTLMEMDCIPAGMELFPAADEEQLAFIKKVIDDCDYYILIVGGRYGSVDSHGVSYTEREYDYAVSRDIRIIAMLHEDPSQIAVGKSESDRDARAKLAEFRRKVSESRLVKTWKDARELPGLVALSLQKTIKTYPAVGWIRGSAAGGPELLMETYELRRKVAALEAQLANSEAERERSVALDLVSMEALIELHGAGFREGLRKTWRVQRSWNDLFALIAPHLLASVNDSRLRQFLCGEIVNQIDRSYTSVSIDDGDYQTIKVQMMAYGLVRVRAMATTEGGTAVFWSLTPKGERVMMQLKSVQRPPSQ